MGTIWTPGATLAEPLLFLNGKEVIERVRRDDPSAYLRVIASVVCPASEPEAEHPFANMTFEELKAELLAGLVRLSPSFELSLRGDRHWSLAQRTGSNDAAATNSSKSGGGCFVGSASNCLTPR